MYNSSDSNWFESWLHGDYPLRLNVHSDKGCLDSVAMAIGFSGLISVWCLKWHLITLNNCKISSDVLSSNMLRGTRIYPFSYFDFVLRHVCCVLCFSFQKKEALLLMINDGMILVSHDVYCYFAKSPTTGILGHIRKVINELSCDHYLYMYY